MTAINKTSKLIAPHLQQKSPRLTSDPEGPLIDCEALILIKAILATTSGLVKSPHRVFNSAKSLPTGAVNRTQRSPRAPRIPVPRSVIVIQESDALRLLKIEPLIRHVLRKILLRSDVQA